MIDKYFFSRRKRLKRFRNFTIKIQTTYNYMYLSFYNPDNKKTLRLKYTDFKIDDAIYDVWKKYKGKNAESEKALQIKKIFKGYL